MNPEPSCFAGKPIFSVDIHPDGTKFATGGQGILIGTLVCESGKKNFILEF